jgi:hypothetical protein
MSDNKSKVLHGGEIHTDNTIHKLSGRDKMRQKAESDASVQSPGKFIERPDNSASDKDVSDYNKKKANMKKSGYRAVEK